MGYTEIEEYLRNDLNMSRKMLRRCAKTLIMRNRLRRKIRKLKHMIKFVREQNKKPLTLSEICNNCHGRCNGVDDICVLVAEK